MELVIVGLISPAVMAVLLHLLRRSERREDWARQDEVAARVKEVAENVDVQHHEITDRLDHVDEVNDKIHMLVNSKLTAALEGQLDSLLGQAVLMRAEPNIVLPGAQEALKSVEARIDALQTALMDRAETDAAIREDP